MIYHFPLYMSFHSSEDAETYYRDFSHSQGQSQFENLFQFLTQYDQNCLSPCSKLSSDLFDLLN